MLILVLIAFALISGITYFQYREQIKDYNKDRLERKEAAIKKDIDRTLKETTFLLQTDKIHLIFKDEIYEIARIHGENITLYDLEGHPLISSTENIFENSVTKDIPKRILDTLTATSEKRYVERIETEIPQQISYSYINDPKFKELAILQIQYEDSESFINKEMRELLIRIGVVALIVFITAIFLAFILARYITLRLKDIEEKIKETQLDKRNKKVDTKNLPTELLTLVSAYNGMIDELEESAAQLAQNEREAAWREMAKQVAHEIKNPLTPMRLTVQSFERRFDPEDPEINTKIKEYSNTLIQQIDTMSSIASAFSNFADMPAQQSETLDVSNVVKLALDIFRERNIAFAKADQEIRAKFDRTQLIRVVTNLVKNAIQATKHTEEPKILVDVQTKESNVQITVSDNGIGITEENKPKIFEPKFTTKTSGMGLGLAMVKNIMETYNGSINFTSQEGKGTVFTVTFPKE
ncbi:HAMP domain-containing sensor histidine kinase [uncultured Dokdonia sp.]|uniref:sensor histidine kinase n=1 Tax=uncultured Dokdonia sp. TaxID=575653 RepID=UPI00262B40FB|nr:HAMP domain-containing sensor histidine kinase [uncultured Dokdonia sp.]